MSSESSILTQVQPFPGLQGFEIVQLYSSSFKSRENYRYTFFKMVNYRLPFLVNGVLSVFLYNYSIFGKCMTILVRLKFFYLGKEVFIVYFKVPIAPN